MTTFKNNAKYAELLFTYLDAAYRSDTPLTVEEVLSTFEWSFKGGSLREAAAGTRLKPDTSADEYPSVLSGELAELWPVGREAVALRAILQNRLEDGRLRSRGVVARLATYQMITSSFGLGYRRVKIFSGMRAVYYTFGRIWDWALRAGGSSEWLLLESYTRELVIGTGAVSRVHLPTAENLRKEYSRILSRTRLPALLQCISQVKELMAMLNGPTARGLARREGREEMTRWHPQAALTDPKSLGLTDRGAETRYLNAPLGPLTLRVAQGVALVGIGEVRHALGQSDVERLHQLTMSAASALVGVCAQAVVGTARQKLKARRAVEVAEANIGRIVMSSRRVPLGDEVLVCKGYRRAYTALLGVLAGPLCAEETSSLVEEAEGTAGEGVLDVRGLLSDARSLDAAGALNASKMFKICPAPDVSPGLAMMDRIKTIGDSNIMDPEIREPFREELRSQILRAYIRSGGPRLELRDRTNHPLWFAEYLRGEFDSVPSSEIHEFLKWEGTSRMPEVSQYDPGNWKDSGLGADSLREGMSSYSDKHKANMITRLLFDNECPMPGKARLASDHVIKFFTKAEGHKDPARGIFSANLRDRQAQSWMERAVDTVARHHPSYMIGQEVDAREAKAVLLNTRPERGGDIALFYSFDISGWSAKMPADPQRISHSLWAELYGGHLFSVATKVNEGACIYMNLDGYKGWYTNTHSNLEGFNGKEMTMVLVALLALSVRRWRVRVVEEGVMEEAGAARVSALLFAYIDDGLSRIDLPGNVAARAFKVYKETVISTFASCGFTIEISKCFPSDRFAIFLNEVYLAGRHVVHGVRAAMGICSEPTERHTSLVERTTSVCTGIRGAVIAGLEPLSAVLLMSHHLLLHLREWVAEKDPVILAGWSITPRSWGGLGVPNMLQVYISGSGAAFEESVATMQAYAMVNPSVAKAYLALCRSPLEQREATGIMTAPLSGRTTSGYMVDSRIAVAVRRALKWKTDEGMISRYARRLLKYSDTKAFERYAEAIVPRDPDEVLQEQMLTDLCESHPHSVFAAFARRMEKSSTVRSVVGVKIFVETIARNRDEALQSVEAYRRRTR